MNVNVNIDWKKRTRISLAVILAGSLLAGCSKAADPEASTASSTPTADKPVEISFLLPLFDPVQDMNNEAWKEIQRLTNSKLNIEWVPSSDYGTKLDLVLASNSLPDVVLAETVNRPTVLKAYDNGAFWDLKPFLGDFSKYPNLKKNSAPDIFKYVTRNGKIMGMPRNRPSINNALMFRQDWLDKLGLSMPTTMDEYANVMVAMANNDPDGNGKKDTYGFVHPNGGTGIPNQFVAGFGGLKPHFTSDGTGLIHTTLNSGYTDAVAWMRELYARGAIMQEFTTVKKTQANEMIETAHIGSFVENVWRAWTFQGSMRKVDPKAEVTIGTPKGPAGDPAVNLGLVTYGALYISKKVPEAKVRQILDFWERSNTEEVFNQIYFGKEGVHYNNVNGNKVMTEKGIKEIVPTLQQPVPLAYSEWWKSFNVNAPREYNDKIWSLVKDQPATKSTDPFSYLISDTWTANNAKLQSEWSTKVVEAIIGKISMDDYKKYVDKLLRWLCINK